MSVKCMFYFEDMKRNRKKLFEEALKNAQHGKILYITYDELEELPQLSQDLSSTNRHFFKMISFLYVKSIELLIETLSTLPDWQSVPISVILDNLCDYCNKNNLYKACAVIALLLNSVRSCAEVLAVPCTLHISANSSVIDENFISTLRELYF